MNRLVLTGVIMVCAGTALLGETSASGAIYTPVTPRWANEQTHPEILSHVYGDQSGSDFTLITGTLDYTNGTVIAHRLTDDVSGSPDQVFPAGEYVTSAQARYADYDQEFGYSTQSAPTTFIPLFSVDGSGYTLTQTNTGQSIPDDQAIYFARSGNRGETVFSDPSLNFGNIDNMVTYQIIDGQRQSQTLTYLLFFNDGQTDQDFNDIVIEVHMTPVPEPATAGIALALLGGGAMVTRPRRRRAV